MALDNDGTSDNGYMNCKLGGSFVGEYLYVQVSLEVKNAFYTFRCSHINHHLK